MAELISLLFRNLVVLSLTWHLRISLKFYTQREKHLLLQLYRIISVTLFTLAD